MKTFSFRYLKLPRLLPHSDLLFDVVNLGEKSIALSVKAL